MLEPSYVRGLTLLGGEPMEPSNQRSLLPFIQKVRTAFPQKSIWCYTGFTWEQLHTEGHHAHTEVTDALLSLLDVLVDGRFVEALKDPSLWFRGSSNQRLIDIPQTLSRGEIILLPSRDRQSRLHISN